MIYKRVTKKNIVPITITILVFFILTRNTIKNLQCVLHKKEAIGRVISTRVPDPKQPTTYLVETKFFNEYKHDSTNSTITLKEFRDTIPNRIRLHYDDKNDIYTDFQQRITWGTVIWNSLVSLLILSYLALELTTFSIPNGKRR